MIEMFRQNWRSAAAIAAAVALVGAFAGVAIGTYAAGAWRFGGEVTGAAIGAFLAVGLSTCFTVWDRRRDKRELLGDLRSVLKTGLKHIHRVRDATDVRFAHGALQELEHLLTGLQDIAPTLNRAPLLVLVTLHRLSRRWRGEIYAARNALDIVGDGSNFGRAYYLLKPTEIALNRCLAIIAALGHERFTWSED